MSPVPDILTPRLRLVAATADSSAADAAQDHARLGHLLAANRGSQPPALLDRSSAAAAVGEADRPPVTIPPAWPPKDLRDVQGLLADRLRDHPDQAGWWGWFMIARAGVVGTRETLIGALGCTRWGEANRLQFGYGILPDFERRGLTKEAAGALIHWVFSHPRVDLVEATTFERHAPSVRILEHCGFTCRGVSDGDAVASEDDRQGRGRLLLFVRER